MPHDTVATLSYKSKDPIDVDLTNTGIWSITDNCVMYYF